MSALVIGIILIVGGVVFAAAPLLRRRPEEPPELPADGVAPVVAGDALAGAPGRRPIPAPVPAELEELELDRAMGKMGDEDYQRLRAALAAREEGGSAAAGTAPSPARSREPSAADAAEGAPRGETSGESVARLEAEAERLVREARASLARCDQCGPRPEPGARFCSRCGGAVGGCPSCGAPVRVSGARFCDQCGGALRA